MRPLLGFVRKIFFWNYARNTWQWDVLCAVILIFIFLTPKSWFEDGERNRANGHQMPAISTLLVSADVVETRRDAAQLEEHVRTMTGRPDDQVVQVRKRVGQDGRTLGYEVDIR